MVSVEAPATTPPSLDAKFVVLATPQAGAPLKSPFGGAADKETLFEQSALKPKWILYTSVLAVLLQPLQYG